MQKLWLHGEDGGQARACSCHLTICLTMMEWWSGGVVALQQQAFVSINVLHLLLWFKIVVVMIEPLLPPQKNWTNG